MTTEATLRARIAEIEAAGDRLAQTAKAMCEAVKVARGKVPHDDDGFAASLFAWHLNALEPPLRRCCAAWTKAKDQSHD